MCCCAHRATSALARRMPRLNGQPGVQSSSSAHQSAAKAAATQSRRHRGARGAALGFCQVKSRRWGPQVSPELASIATETQAPASLRSHARPPLAPYSAAGSGHAARGAARTQAQRLEMQRRGRQEARRARRAPAHRCAPILDPNALFRPNLAMEGDAHLLQPFKQAPALPRELLARNCGHL